MELIDRDVLFNSFNDCSCECGVCQYSLDGLPCGLIENAPTVEAIPKADYENRLKADLVAMLTDIQLEIEEKYPKCDLCEYFVDYDYDENDISEYRSVGSITDITNFIQQKINSLKENNDV